MKKKNNDLVKNLHEEIISGKAVIHTKTEEQKEQDKKALEKKKVKAFVGTPILLTAALYKLQELQDMGAVKMRTKMLVGQTIKSMEHDLDTIFDGVVEGKSKKEAKKEDLNSGSLLDEGARYLEEGLDKFLTLRTNVDEE